MQTFYIHLTHSETTREIITRASTMEDAILQIRAFNHSLTHPFEIERISKSKAKGVQYSEW